ncbi:putative serpin-Z8 [Triticum aestivum]|uniref:Putative serpin-Z8 n=1 Tax=Aegilops tauschii TaxID=37682 RepID=R7W536_AEGTA|nr:putative serpin-Z8 [Triticum aestivum]
MEVTRDTTQSCSGGLAALAASLASRLADDNADSNLILGVLGAPSRAALDEFLSRVAEDALEDHSESGGPRVAFACGVWTDLTCPLKPAYRHAAASTYKADASTVDFRNNPEAARGQINAWVAQVKRKLIGSVLGPGSITPLTRAVLGNAIYFKGKWEKPFRKKRTADKLFHRLDGRTVDVPFMQSRSSQFIAVHKGFKVIRLSIHRLALAGHTDALHLANMLTGRRADRDKRAQFSMCVFLPDAFNGLPGLVDAIASQPGFRHKHLPKEKIHVREFRVPKFKLSFHRSVVTIINKLGLRLPFSDQADLSDMVEGDGSGLPLVLSDIIHKAVIEVNEEGTEATAVTLMDMEIGCSRIPPPPPPRVDFVADHLFAYFIVEEAIGAVVFVGHVLDPSAL